MQKTIIIVSYKLILISIITLFILTINTNKADAQVFSSDQNPPALQWKQINTKNFQIIYPSSIETEAQRMANSLQKIIKNETYSLTTNPRKISVILQNQGTSSNGFVQLAPRRTEFYTMPSQDFDYQNWLNSLAVHELRHVVQFDKLTGNLKAPFFEELALAIYGITLPPWFYEGDAVGVETALTTAGRGRQPEWDITFRANILSNRKFSYSKDFLGSFKDLTPGYYQLGYYLTTKLRRDYGSGILNSIYRRMSANPVRPYNLSNSIKKYTGITTKQLHDSTVTELHKLWAGQLDTVRWKTYPFINKRLKKLPENFLLPAVEKNGKILFLYESKSHTPALKEIDTAGNVRTLLKIGIQENPGFNYAAGKIVWDEFRYDPRYHQRSFNVINIYDINTKSYRQLTHRTRLFAPALSPDGKRIISVNISYSNHISLVELDAQNGKEIKRFTTPQNYMLQTPQYNSDGNKIVAVSVSQQGTTLIEFNERDQSFHQLIPFQKQLISHPVFAGDKIIFKAHYDGIDNLYRLDPDTGEILQLTSVKFGAFNPNFDTKNKRIYFNNYQADGYDISYLSLKDNPGIPLDSVNNSSINYIGPVVEQEGNKNVFDSIPNHKFQSKPYREISHLFYFHSLIPVIEENNYNNYNYGLKLQSDNKLNTLSFYAGYRYNNGLKRSEYLSGFTYSRFYPVLDISYTNQADMIYRRVSSDGQIQLIPINWREHVINAGITVPFIFNRLNDTYSAGFKTGTSYTARYDIENRPNNFINFLNFPMYYKVYFYHNTLRSSRNLASPWGQNLSLTYRNFPFETQAKGELLTFRSTFYFPGLFPNHSLQASFNYQHGRGNYNQVNDIPYIRGFAYLRPVADLRNTLLLDYRFPIFYPDWELGPLAYIKRFKGGFFADFQNIGKGNPLSPQSYGAELRADMNLLRFYLPNFDLGGRIIFPNEKSNQNPIFETTFSYTF